MHSNWLPEETDNSSEEDAIKDLLIHGEAVVDRRIMALEMAIGLVCNRSDGFDGEDAVGVTRIADVLLEWLERGDADV